MSRVAVIGAGDLGGACMQALASGGRVARVLMIDSARNAAAGKALDIQQSGAVDGFHCRLSATDDVSEATAVDACIVADRFGPPAAEWNGEDALAMVGRLLAYAPAAPIIFAGSSQGELMEHVGIEARTEGLNVPRERVIGSASEAYASAIRSIVALEARSSPGEVMLAVLGAPPRIRATDGGFVVAWSEASIGGYALDRVLTPVQLTRIEARAARLWPPGPYTLGIAAARMAEAILTTSRRTFSALTLLGGEFGVRNRVGALPVLLSRTGIVDVRVPSLSARERVKLESALGANS